jgi:putative Mg2+ transporter-C (MgtC) family protein
MPYFELEAALRLFLAAVLGGLIGIERERSMSPAGLRTHALVSVASALVMIVSTYGFMNVLAAGRIVLDPSRVAAQVVSGVGFLGAGIIIFRRNAVRGLNTAASIWAVAAVGLACGCGLYVSAVSATLIMWLILTVMKLVEKKYFPSRPMSRLTVEVANKSHTKLVSEKFKIPGINIANMTIKHAKGEKMIVKVEAMAEEKVFVGLLHELQSLPEVESVQYDGHVLPISELGEFEDEQPS